jgi:hypothetical protein
MEFFFKKLLPKSSPLPSSVILRDIHGMDLPSPTTLFALQSSAKEKGEDIHIVFERDDSK